MIVSRYKKLTGVFVALSVVYLALSVLLPKDKTALHKYHLTAGQDVVLTFTITIPYLIIWFVSLVGYLRLRSYTDAIQKGKDGSAFQTLANGLLWLSVWLPLSAVLGTIIGGYYRAHPSSTPEMVTLNNYINVLILLPAFWQVQKGSLNLLRVIKKPASRLPQSLMMLFIAFSAFYLLLVLHDPARQFPVNGVTVASYYLPDWLITLTIVIPSLITWHFGMQAIYNLYLYRKGVKGPIYKQALNDLATGLAWVIVTLVVLRGFESTSSQLTKLSLGIILLVVYLLLIILTIGYVLIAKGAKSLQRIEEI